MVVVTPDYAGKPAPKPAPKAEDKKTKKSGK
jgi:hypothetical protein